MPFPNEHSARLRRPGEFVRFRRQNNAGGRGIDFIFGITKGGEAEIQAIRFKSSIYTVAEAKAWLREHKMKPILFEQAESKSQETIDKWRECVAKFTNDKSMPVVEQAVKVFDLIKGNSLLFFNVKALRDESLELYRRIEVFKKVKNEPVMPVIKGVINDGVLLYAVDSAKPREGDNLSKLVDMKEEIEDGELVEVEIGKIMPVLKDGKWQLELHDYKFLRKIGKGKPNTTKEILAIADSLGLIVCSQATRDELFKLKLVKFAENPASEVKKNLNIIKDTKRQIVYGIVYEPMKRDAHGDYATPEEIEKAAHKFLSNYNSINLMHQKEVGNRAKVVESYIAPDNLSINGEHIPKGAWVMGVHIPDKKLWAAVEKGELNAFSIEGTAKAGPRLM